MIWKRENIKDLTELFTDGDWIETKNQSVDGIRLIQTGNIGFGKFKHKEDKKRFISINTFEKLKCKEIYPGDILTSRLPDPVGKSCIIPDIGERMITGVDCSIIRLKPHVDKVFFAYYQMSNEYLNEVNSRVTGTTRSRISRKNLGQIKVPIPPLSEQKQIVETLDKAFEKIDKAIANIERNIQNAEELFQSKMEKLLFKESDDRKNSTIGEVCELMTGGTPSKKKKEYFEKGDINWLVSGDIHKKEIHECNGKITSLGLEQSNAKYLPVNSVMIALNGQGKTRGTVAMLRIKATCNQSLVSIYPKDLSKLTPEFIYVNLNSRYNEIRKLTGDSGNDRRGLNMPLLKKISLSIPKSIEEQKNIIESFYILKNNTDRIVENNSKKINLLNDLKKSILEKAFKGELTSAA